MSYFRLLSRLYGQPLAVSEDKLDILTSEVTMKLLAGETLAEKTQSEAENSPKDKKLAIIPIYDGLVARNGAGSASATSYQEILASAETFISAGHTTLYFPMSTPGGEVETLFSTTKALYDLRARGIETIGFVDGQVASAGMVLASAFSKLYATKSSLVGSMAIIATVVSKVEEDKLQGREYKILRSKDNKAKLNPHEEFDSEALSDLQVILSEMDTQLGEVISANRPSISLETINKLDGKAVLAEEALSLGLIDGIYETFDQVKAISTPTRTLITKPKGISMNLEQALAKNIELSAEIVALKASHESEVVASATAERSRIVGILSAAKTFKLEASVAEKSILNASRSISDATEMFEQIAENIDASTEISPEGDRGSAREGSSIPATFSEGLDLALEASETNTLFKGMK